MLDILSVYIAFTHFLGTKKFRFNAYAPLITISTVGGKMQQQVRSHRKTLKPRNFKTIKQLLNVRIQQQLISSKNGEKLYCIRRVKKHVYPTSYVGNQPLYPSLNGHVMVSTLL